MSDENEIRQIATNIVDVILANFEEQKNKGKDIINILVSSSFWDSSWTFEVTMDTKINRIKTMVLYQLFKEDSETYTNIYKLVFPIQKRTLRNPKSVRDELLKNNDELELVKLPETDYFHVSFMQAISTSMINQQTSHLPKPIMKTNVVNIFLEHQQPEFMSDIRKIMISLVEYSLVLMSKKPNAKYIFDTVRRKLMSENFYINEPTVNKYRARHPVSTRRIKFAVNASYNESFSVHEWLDETRSVDSHNLAIPRTFHVEETMSIEEELFDLLEFFRLFLRASFKVCPKAKDLLTSMGFEDEHVRKALRYTGNNTSESVEFLIGNTDPNNDGAKPGLDNGISKTSDLYKILLSEVDIILPLCNPNVLYACLSVMDANSFLISSIRFPMMMNMLNKILTTYYVSKCDMMMNQMQGIMPND